MTKSVLKFEGNKSDVEKSHTCILFTYNLFLIML